MKLGPILHIINRPFPHPAFDMARSASTAQDAFLFIEDGVTALLAGGYGDASLCEWLAAGKAYGLAADIQARGIGGKLVQWVEVVDYDGFVELTELYSTVLSWF